MTGNRLFSVCLVFSAIVHFTSALTDPTLEELDLTRFNYNLENINCLHIDSSGSNEAHLLICHQCDILHVRLLKATNKWTANGMIKVTRASPNCKNFEANFITDVAIYPLKSERWDLVYTEGENTEVFNVSYKFDPQGKLIILNDPAQLNLSDLTSIGGVKGLLHYKENLFLMATHPHSSRHNSGRSITQLSINDVSKLKNIQNFQSNPNGLCRTFKDTEDFFVVTTTGLQQLKFDDQTYTPSSVAGREARGRKVIAIDTDRVVVVPLTPQKGVIVVDSTETASRDSTFYAKYFLNHRFTGIDFHRKTNTLFLSTRNKIYLAYNATHDMKLPYPATMTASSTTKMTFQVQSTTLLSTLTAASQQNETTAPRELIGNPPISENRWFLMTVSAGSVLLIVIVVIIVTIKCRIQRRRNQFQPIVTNEDLNSVQSSELDSTNGVYEKMTGNASTVASICTPGLRWSGLPLSQQAAGLTTGLICGTTLQAVPVHGVQQIGMLIERQLNSSHQQDQETTSTEYEGAESAFGTIFTSKRVQQPSMFYPRGDTSVTQHHHLPLSTATNVRSSFSPDFQEPLDENSSAAEFQAIEVTDPAVQEALSLFQ